MGKGYGPLGELLVRPRVGDPATSLIQNDPDRWDSINEANPTILPHYSLGKTNQKLGVRPTSNKEVKK